MAEFSNSAEGGTNGSTVTISNSGGASGNAFDAAARSGTGTLTYSNASSAHGGLSIHVNSPLATDTSFVVWSTGNDANVAARFYLYLNALPSSSVNILTVRSASAQTAVIALNSTNRLQLQNSASGVVNTMTTSLSINTWYRVELQATVGATTSTGSLAYQYFALDDTTPLGSFSTTTTNTGSAPVTTVRFGDSSGSSGFINMLVDDMKVNFGSALALGPVANSAPTANAGPDQSSIEPYMIVTLDGNDSTDADGNPLTYSWTQTGGLPVVTLTGSTTATPSFTAPATLDGTTLTFSLTVNDGQLPSAPDSVNIEIVPHTVWLLGDGGTVESPIAISVI